ncbi:hypothetical protein ACUUMB_22845 [Enterobacter kobei]
MKKELITTALMIALLPTTCTALSCYATWGTGAVVETGMNTVYPNKKYGPTSSTQHICLTSSTDNGIRLDKGEAAAHFQGSQSTYDHTWIFYPVDPVVSPDCNGLVKIGEAKGVVVGGTVLETLRTNLWLYSTNPEITTTQYVKLVVKATNEEDYIIQRSFNAAKSSGTNELSLPTTVDVEVDAGNTTEVSIPYSKNITPGLPAYLNPEVTYRIRTSADDGVVMTFNNGLQEITENMAAPNVRITAGREARGSYERVIDATISCP